MVVAAAGITGGGGAGSTGVVGVEHAQPGVAGGSEAGGLRAGGLGAGVESGAPQSPHAAIGSRGGFGWFVAAAAAVWTVVATSTAHAAAKSALFTPASLMVLQRWPDADQQPHECVKCRSGR